MDASDSSPQHSSEEDEEENDSSEEEDDEEEHEDEEEQEEEDDEEEDEEDIGPRAVEITEASVNYKCCFCGRHEINSVEWGVMLKLDDIVLHHFCLLFSSAIEQNGKDKQGFQGFLPNDVITELRRGKRLKCKYCKKSNATIGCAYGICRTSFHFTCGYENGCLAQFHGQFKAFCPNHKSVQKIPPGTCMECSICFIETEENDEVVWPPCCGKQVFHRRCISYAAHAAGYAFKCPLCNCKTRKFKRAMQTNGIHIPQHPSAWETEPNAYQELLTHYSHCDAKKCLCPDGRDFNPDKDGARIWQLIRCLDCGHSATHLKCSNLKTPAWQCNDCKLIEQNLQLGQKDEDVDDDSSAEVDSSLLEDSGADDMEGSISSPQRSSSPHAPDEEEEDSSEDQDEKEKEEEESEDEIILNQSGSAISNVTPDLPTQRNNPNSPSKLSKTGTVQDSASAFTNGIPASRGIGGEVLTSLRRSLRQRQCRSEKLNAASPVYNVDPNPALGVVLMEKPVVNNSSFTGIEIESQEFSKLEEEIHTNVIPPIGQPELDSVSVAKEKGLGLEPVAQERKEDETEPNAKFETVNVEDSDDDVVEIEPDIVIEKVILKVSQVPPQEQRSAAFTAMLQRRGGNFPAERSTSTALFPSRRPWSQVSKRTICLEDEPVASTSSGAASGEFNTGTRHRSTNSLLSSNRNSRSDEPKRKRHS